MLSFYQLFYDDGKLETESKIICTEKHRLHGFVKLAATDAWFKFSIQNFADTVYPDFFSGSSTCFTWFEAYESQMFPFG